MKDGRQKSGGIGRETQDLEPAGFFGHVGGVGPVHVQFRAGQAGYETLEGFERELSGEDVLAGFALDLRKLR